MKIRLLAIAAALASTAVLTGLPAPSEAMPILTISNGQLTGARNVEANGTLYDVSFREGSCISLFNGCNSPNDFIFSSRSTSRGFLTALQNQVFVNTAQGAFDSNPGLTAGCSGANCSIYLPLPVGNQFFADLDILSNGRRESEDFIFSFPVIGRATDTSLLSNAVFAVVELAPLPAPEVIELVDDEATNPQPVSFNPADDPTASGDDLAAAIAVPEPATALVFALGLLLLALGRLQSGFHIAGFQRWTARSRPIGSGGV